MSDNGVAATLRPNQLAPHSVEAEEAVLGSILINQDAYYEVRDFLYGPDFFIVRNQWVYEAIAAVVERGEAVDNLSMTQELRNQERLDGVGGSAYIAYLINNTPTHIHAKTYGRIVERAALRRRLLAAASEIAQTALSENAEIEDVISHAETTLFGVTERKIARDLVSMRQAASTYYDEVERRVNEKGKVGLPTGFTDLDNLLGGLRKSSLNILAARPGMGKTALAMNIATNVARKYKKQVAVFSLEMDRDELLDRIYSSEMSINSQKLQMGQLDACEWGLFTEVSERVGKWPIHIDDTPEISVNQIRTKCKRLAHDNGLDLVIVDYLQLMLSDKDTDNRNQEVAAISRGLKVMAKTLKIPVLALAQLNRDLEKRQDKRPILSDLRDSGALEQDADLVMFLYRDEVYNENTERPSQCDVIVSKNRKGPTGVKTLYFHREFTRFDNMGKDHVDLSTLGG